MNQTKKTYHHGDLRASLLDAAATIVREQGVDGLSIRKLAETVGVSRTAPYHHFADKRELLLAIAKEGFDRLPSYADAAVNAPGLSFSDKMRAFVRSYVGFAQDNPEYYDLMFGREIWHGKLIPEHFKAVAHASFRRYAETIGRWQEEGNVSSELDSLRFAQVSWSTLHGLSRLLIDGIYVDRDATNAMCDAASDMILAALKQAEPTAEKNT